MPTFHYNASDSNGQSLRGTLLAATRDEVLSNLRTRGLFLISCKTDDVVPIAKTVPSATDPAFTIGASTRLSSYLKKIFREKDRDKITPKELVILTRQIGVSIKAGMSFIDVIQKMSQRAKNPFTAYILRSILNDVLSGKKFSAALSKPSAVARRSHGA